MSMNLSNATHAVMNKTGITTLWKAFKLALGDLAKIVPEILLILAIIATYFALAVLITKLIRRLFSLLRVDELLKPFIKQTYFSLSGLITALIDLGIALLAVYTIVLTIAPHQIHTLNVVMSYISRVVSVVFLVLFMFIALNAIVDRIRVEAKMKGFILLLLIFVTIVPTLDITALSPEVKSALAWGLSLGIGLSIGVFSAWYFFHEILERRSSSCKSD